jgi:ABC-type phosphate/phosphonate transport system ATPase subunit
MIGEKVETKNGLDFYDYPHKELSDIEKKLSSYIIVIGETEVGKSTWLHCFINYLQGIKIEENNRYYLFNEKKLQEEYERQTGRKIRRM